MMRTKPRNKFVSTIKVKLNFNVIFNHNTFAIYEKLKEG
jgi:hypothetical protein